MRTGRSHSYAQFPAVLALIAGLLLSSAAPTASYGQAAGTRHVLLVGGLGGDAQYSDRFASYLSETRTTLVDRHGVPNEQIRVLGESAIADRPFVDDVSTAENIRAYFEELSRRVTVDDHVYVILFGHGSFDGTRAAVNIPRRDLYDSDYAEMLDNLRAGRVVFINTTSASGPFAKSLRGENRIIVTATATGTERDETVFPRFLVEALQSAASDLDKSGGLSVREVFAYAAHQASRSFEESGHLATEHAQIEDDGDGEPTRADQLEAGNDGHLASVTYVRPPSDLAQADASERPLLRERESLERSIAELKSRKSSMGEDEYYVELETLFVRLARLNDRLEADR